MQRYAKPGVSITKLYLFKMVYSAKVIYLSLSMEGARSLMYSCLYTFGTQSSNSHGVVAKHNT